MSHFYPSDVPPVFIGKLKDQHQEYLAANIVSYLATRGNNQWDLVFSDLDLTVYMQSAPPIPNIYGFFSARKPEGNNNGASSIYLDMLARDGYLSKRGETLYAVTDKFIALCDAVRKDDRFASVRRSRGDVPGSDGRGR
jgi:hypothetical protein